MRIKHRGRASLRAVQTPQAFDYALLLAAHRSAAGLELKIADALKKGGFVNKPEVSAMITAFRSKQVSVLGQVNRPGKFSLETVSTVADLLALAGPGKPADQFPNRGAIGRDRKSTRLNSSH